MKRRTGVLTALACVMVLLGGAAAVSAGGFERIDLDIDTGALADFGEGEVDYRAVATIPAVVRQDQYSSFQRWTMDGVRYNKVDEGAPGPEYFDIVSGTFTGFGVGDPDDPTVGFGGGAWRFDIVTDAGVEYRSTGLIIDFNRTPDRRDVWRWNGPVIEP